MFKGFKEFLLRGNVIDLAVAVVIGAAFNAVVEKVVATLINPLIGLLFAADSLDDALKVGLPNGDSIAFGALIGAIINFLIVAAVVYFVFVLPMNELRKRTTKPEDEAPTGPSEQELLADIRDLLKQQSGAKLASPAVPATPAASAAHADTPPAN